MGLSWALEYYISYFFSFGFPLKILIPKKYILFFWVYSRGRLGFRRLGFRLFIAIPEPSDFFLTRAWSVFCAPNFP